jgi:ABC-type methionine transport system ATPase subunit
MHLIADFFLRQGDFTLEVGLEWQGSAFGIFGPSGAGKSTLRLF